MSKLIDFPQGHGDFYNKLENLCKTYNVTNYAFTKFSEDTCSYSYRLAKDAPVSHTMALLGALQQLSTRVSENELGSDPID